MTAPKEVICQFCQKKCRRFQEKGFTPHLEWRCDYHGGVVVKYIYPNATETWHTVIMAYVTDDHYYHANFFYDNPNLNYKFRVDHMKRGFLGTLEANEVFRLDFHPDITPENLPDKITKYIIFS